MSGATKKTNSGRSKKRWEDGHRLVNEIFPTLPSPSHRNVLMLCWFFGELTDKGHTVFDLTKEQISTRCGISERRVRQVFKDLEEAKVIITRKNGCNAGGRGLGSERMITWRPYQAIRETIKGEASFTVSGK
ncbi:hypothetical protein [Roseiconus lacunae]|uniref:Helix-turn-helix domain-containing protein n=1 Tax=Roseiconus lacunae TaxID=2605694 RepID=A0ABT7PEH4_9BACT|nr:hypothetical protein [Roseiconus lacunae]MDM4014689.1 hypothetical protein [Roseiconus lacunae]